MDMIYKIRRIAMTLLFLTAIPITAQVLLSEDFESHPTGSYTTGPGGLYPIKGGQSPYITVDIEPGRGRVLIIKHLSSSYTGSGGIRQPSGVMDSLWNTRTPGNDILKFELEFYGTSNGAFNAIGSITGDYSSSLISINFQYLFLSNKRVLGGYLYDDNMPYTGNFGPNGTDSDFPRDTWIKVEMFVDYTTNNVHFYIPTLNIHTTGSFSHNQTPGHITVGAGALENSSLVKYDNIKVSALQTLPSYLGVSDFVSSKFKVFPNPVTEIVTITNSESIGIEQIEVFDISGKIVKSQKGNNENEMQVDISDFTSAMYLLHIQTKEGTAVKKVVKK